MVFYIVRRGALTGAVNTENNLNTDPDGNTPGLIVPGGVSKIKQIIVALSASIVAVGSAGVTIVLRLKGAGVSVQQDIPVGGLREDTTSTAGAKFQVPFVLDTDIDVNAGQALGLAGIMGGVDPGSPEISVGLAFA